MSDQPDVATLVTQIEQHLLTPFSPQRNLDLLRSCLSALKGQEREDEATKAVKAGIAYQTLKEWERKCAEAEAALKGQTELQKITACTYCGETTHTGERGTSEWREAMIDHMLACEKRPEARLVEALVAFKAAMQPIASRWLRVYEGQPDTALSEAMLDAKRCYLALASHPVPAPPASTPEPQEGEVA